MAKSRRSIPDTLINNISDTLIISPRCREMFLSLDAEGAEALRDRGVQVAGVSDLKSPFIVGRADPPFHVVLFTIAGAARYRTRDHAGIIESGSLWIGPAHTAHAYEAVDEWVVCWFHFAPWALTGATSLQTEAAVNPMHTAMEGFVSESVRGEPGAADAARAYAALIGVFLDRALGPPSHPVQRSLAGL